MSGIVVLISGRGSNLRSIVDAGLPVAAVISNRSEAAGLAWARSRGIPSTAVEHRAYSSRKEFEASLVDVIDRHAPRLVVLAGFMRILTTSFVARYAGRLMNIHPSLLPAFPGLHTHAAVLAAGVKIHGATVHFVTPELDRGPIIIQAAVPVRRDDDADTLAARVLEQELVIYPLAIHWFLDGRLVLANDRVEVAGDGAQQFRFADQ